MATEFVRQPLTAGFNPSRVIGWVKAVSGKLLSKKKYLVLGGAGAVLLAAAAYYFWGGQASAAEYLTARIDRGNLRNTVTATGRCRR